MGVFGAIKITASWRKGDNFATHAEDLAYSSMISRTVIARTFNERRT